MVHVTKNVVFCIVVLAFSYVGGLFNSCASGVLFFSVKWGTSKVLFYSYSMWRFLYMYADIYLYVDHLEQCLVITRTL